jgi:PAS domain S-box-containing protein
MRRPLLFFIIFFFLTVFLSACAQNGDGSSTGPVILTDQQDKYPLGPYLELLEDPSGELTIEDVTSPEYAVKFLPSVADVPNLGYSNSAFWVRLPLRNESRLTQWLLYIGWANIQYVDFYEPSSNNSGFTGIETGVFRPPNNRDIPYPRFIFNLSIPTQGVQTYYLRFQNGGSITFPLSLWQPDALARQVQKEQLLEGIFFGVMLGLLFYNLFLFFSLRDRSYLYFVLFLANWIFFEAVYSNYFELYILPDFYYLRRFYQPITFALIFITGILFSGTFLENRTRLPRFHKANIVILGVWGFLLILIPFVSYSILARLMVPWALPTLLSILAAGILSWRNGFRPARFFLFAWFGLIITLAIVILVRIGVIPSTFWTENAYHIGVMWMAVSWSIALADRINLLKAQTEVSNRNLRYAEHRLSQILEGLPLGVVVYDKDFKPNFVNRRAIEILGNPARGILPDIDAGRTLEQAMSYYSFQLADSEQNYPLEKLPVYRALQGEPAMVDDVEADLVDRRVPLEIWANPVVDDAGNIEAAVVAFQDITSRRQAEEALRTSEKKFRVVLENAFDGIAFLGRDREILYVSPSYEKLNGLGAEEMVGGSGIQTIHPDDQAHVAETFQKLLEQPGERASEVYRIRHQDGGWLWVETRAMNLLNDPHVQAVVLNSRDISERIETEAALAEYRQHLERLVEQRTAELSATNKWLSTLKEVRQIVGGTADLPQVCEELLASILGLFDARLVFLLRWDDQEEQFEVECLHRQDGCSIAEPEKLAVLLGNTPPLRGQLLEGNPVRLSADQAESIPGAIKDMVQVHGLQSILLKPVPDGQAVGFVFGIILQQPLQELTAEQVELIRTIALDLVNLIEGAELLDRAQALVVAEERNSLARELHDSVTQILFSASVLAESTPRIWDKDQEIARMNMERLSVLLRGALAEMRTLLFELRSDRHQGQSLENLLTALVESMRARTEVVISLTVNGDHDLPEDVTQVFYRITREALNNVIVHAEAARVSIFTLSKPHCAELHIQDDGRGFDLQEVDAGHLGINIMSERAAKIGGALQIKSTPGLGTEIIAIWPGNETESSEHG